MLTVGSEDHYEWLVTDEQFDEGLAVIEAALAVVAERKQAVLSHA